MSSQDEKPDTKLQDEAREALRLAGLIVGACAVGLVAVVSPKAAVVLAMLCLWFIWG